MSFNLKHVNEYKIYRVPVKFVTNLKRNETERNKMKPIETNWNETKNGNETKLNKIRNQLWLHKSKKKNHLL